MSTLNVSYQTPKHLYEFEIVIDDTIEKTIYCLPIALDPFVYGNDEDIDTVLYPGSVNIELSIINKVPTVPPNPFGDDFNYNSATNDLEYYRLNDALAFSDSAVTVNRDGVEYMIGYVDTQNIGGNYEKKSFRLSVLSNFGKLKDLDPRTLDPADYLSPPYDVSPGQQVLFTDLLLTLIQEVYPTVTQVVLMSDVKSETTYTLLGVPQSVGAQFFGTFNYDYIGAASRYEKASDIVKDVLAIFGAVGVLIGTQFIMQSRFYYSQTTVTILKRQFVKEKGPIPYSSQKLEGLQVLVRPGGTSLTYQELYGTVYVDEDFNIIQDEETVEVIELIAVGGDPPGVDGTVYPLLVRNIWLYIPAFITGLGYDTWVTSVRNSFYVTGGTKKPLWKCVADEIWALVSQNRIIYDASVDGVEWEYNRYYTFENSTLKLRPRKIYFDDTTDTTKLELIQG